MFKKKKILIPLLIALILAFIVVYSVLFQEGNPIPIIKGITALNKENEIVQISKNPEIYLTKTDKGSSSITNLMKNEGWKFEEQFGSGYIFSKDDNKVMITSTQYTGKYKIWKFEISD